MPYSVNKGNPTPALYRGVSGSIARVIDATLRPFAPRFVLSRQRALAGTAAMLNYDMAQRKRTRRGQRAGSADTDLLQDLPEMRKNSRAMVRDDGAASAVVQVICDNVVGTGLHPQVMVDAQQAGISDTEADRWNHDCEQFWEAAANEIDASENDSFVGLQTLVCRSLVTDGETLAHRTYIDNPQRLVGTAFELIDVDRLADPQHGVAADIRSGIEVGDRQQAVAYWITPRHPDEMRARWANDTLRLNKAKRWARHAGGQPSILHIYRRSRPGQTRGVPFFAPCFGLVEAMNDMLETELNAARAAGKFCAFVKQTLDPTALPGNLEQDQEGNWHERLESATIRYLNPGEELQSFSPNRPGNSFEPFVVRVLRSICAACNLPYELVAKDFGKMNYSSARVSLLEARRGFEVLQQLLVDKFCVPVFRATIVDGVISGKLRMPRGFLKNPLPFLRTYWQPPAWGWVDPVKEIDAAAAAIENSLSTPQAEAARQGGDAEANLEARARFMRRAMDVAERHGLPEGALLPPPKAGAAAPPAPQEEPEPEPEPEEAPTE